MGRFCCETLASLFLLPYGYSTYFCHYLFNSCVSHRIKSLISITISNVEIAFVAPHQFVGYGFGVEELNILQAKMKSVHARAFIHVRGLKSLDLSDNELHEMDENAFTEVHL